MRARVAGFVTLVVLLGLSGSLLAGKRKPPAAPFRIDDVSPLSVVAGQPTTVTVTASRRDGVKKRKAKLDRVAADGTVLAKGIAMLADKGEDGDVTAKDGIFTAQIPVDEAAPGEVWIRVAGPKKKPGSTPLAIPVIDDPLPFLSALRSITLPAPVDPEGRLVPADLSDPDAAVLDPTVNQVFGLGDFLVVAETTTPALALALSPRGAATIKLSKTTGNSTAKQKMTDTLTQLGTLGITTTSLFDALSTTALHREGPEAGGMTLNRSRGVLGLTIVRTYALRAALETTNAQGNPVTLIPQGALNHIILTRETMDDFLDNPPIDQTNKRLSPGASTAVHELIHAMGYEQGCYGKADDDESFVDAMEGIVNLKVGIELKKRMNQPTTGDDGDLTCRLADLYEAEPKGRKCMEKLGFTVPTGVVLYPVPTMLQFTAVQGGPATPSPQTLALPTLPSICVTVTIKKPTAFSMSSNPRKKATDLNVSVDAAATTFDENSNEVPLAPGDYQNTIEITSPSLVTSPITYLAKLKVTANQAVQLTDTLSQDFPAGAKICLHRIVGGHVAGPDMCATNHYHGGGATITIDGKGPFADLHPTGCGFGPIVPCQ